MLINCVTHYSLNMKVEHANKPRNIYIYKCKIIIVKAFRKFFGIPFNGVQKQFKV